jgi:hypothetical protein
MNFLLILIFVAGLILFSELIMNTPNVYSQSTYSDIDDPEKPAPIIRSLKQINNNEIKVTWDIAEHPKGIKLNSFYIELAIGLDVDCCGPGTNSETFEEANSKALSSDIREFSITTHNGEPLKTNTKYCIEVESQWPDVNLDSQPMCLIFKENSNNNYSEINYFFSVILILIIIIITMIIFVKKYKINKID